MGKVCVATDITTGMTQIRLTIWPLLHIHADLAKDIGDNLNKFISRRVSTFAIVKVTDKITD